MLRLYLEVDHDSFHSHPCQFFILPWDSYTLVSILFIISDIIVSLFTLHLLFSRQAVTSIFAPGMVTASRYCKGLLVCLHLTTLPKFCSITKAIWDCGYVVYTVFLLHFKWFLNISTHTRIKAALTSCSSLMTGTFPKCYQPLCQYGCPVSTKHFVFEEYYLLWLKQFGAPTRLYGVTFQKTLILLVIARKTSNPLFWIFSHNLLAFNPVFNGWGKLLDQVRYYHSNKRNFISFVLILNSSD
jgi:hypothetical protein